MLFWKGSFIGGLASTGYISYQYLKTSGIIWPDYHWTLGINELSLQIICFNISWTVTNHDPFYITEFRTVHCQLVFCETRIIYQIIRGHNCLPSAGWFSLNRPHWADSVIESQCPSVCLSVCLCLFLRHQMQFFARPLIGPEITWSVPGLSLVNPPGLSSN